MTYSALGLPFDEFVVGEAAHTTSSFTTPAVGSSVTLSLNNSIPLGAVIEVRSHDFATDMLAAVTTGGSSPVVKCLAYAAGQSGVVGVTAQIFLTLDSWRELQFGPFQFALSMQERNRVQKIPLIKKKVPFQPGEFNPSNTSMGSRSTEFFGTVGIGCLGSQGNVLMTQDDLEAERSLLAGLQALGKQQLWVRPDRYLNAWLEEFTFTFQDGTGFRFADWTAKFNADDPRYFDTATVDVLGPWTAASGAGSDPGTAISQLGNTKSFPIVTITCTSGYIGNPGFVITYGSGKSIGIQFSLLTMDDGDILIVNCDPRPENTNNNVLVSLSGVQVNAWPYCVATTDLTNNFNWQYFLPFIETSNYGQGTQTFQSSVNPTTGFNPSDPSGFSYTVAVQYQDVWV